MAKKTENLKTIYISQRILKKLSQIKTSSLTTIIAPMGYGKTTAINWFLEQEKMDSVILRVSIYSNHLGDFWHKFQQGFAGTGFYPDIQKIDFPSDENSLHFFMELLEEYLDKDSRIHYLFLDDFHLLQNQNALSFIIALAKYMGNKLHLIVASRNLFLPGSAIIELGMNLCQINLQDLKLTEKELKEYCQQCKIIISNEASRQIMTLSEGWFSCIYLCLIHYSEWGTIPADTSNIYEIMDETLLVPLSENQRDFMIAMSNADEFTLEMASYITEQEDIHTLLELSIKNNAFVTFLPDHQSFRFHHMLKECTSRRFHELTKEKQQRYQERYGHWYEKNHLYANAMITYVENKDYASLLRVIEKDCSVELSSFSPNLVLSWIKECPEPVLKENPLALLVLMRRYFSWNLIPELFQLKEIFMESIKEAEHLSIAEKDQLLGECDLVMSFLHYNDIAGMSRLHKSAAEKMDHCAFTMGKNGSWTFGSPSVLAMFHKDIGKMDQELETMHDSMPYYYQVTNQHGYGAEYIMEGEAFYLRGDFEAAKISLEKAKIYALEKNQTYILMCCLMLSLRLHLFGEYSLEKDWYKKEKERVKQVRDPLLLSVLDLCAAYYYVLLDIPQKIPSWIFHDQLNQVHLLAPARPMAEIISNQVYLAKKEYAKVIAKEQSVRKICEAYPYTLCILNLEIQLAAAYWAIGQWENAIKHMDDAIAMAEPDQILLLFSENIFYIKSILPEELMKKIAPYNKVFFKQANKIKKVEQMPKVFQNLTEKEQQIASMIAAVKRNKIIADSLCLSEGTVKQHINRIYHKLELFGTPAEKREQLKSLLSIEL
ncbi:MAG: LuxR C-terminal-related transcriptional regulator [Lachnospiraceae bacterium]|nr:LuxR C-terminal-related transcriptional regulator [Lachnospiraceae bacterium]MDY5497009.1 LuxR C-terminal-related transcriptional regulator [Anaerobutyricum sp.]